MQWANETAQKVNVRFATQKSIISKKKVKFL